MAQFIKYTSSDTGAPQLSGYHGTLLTVLDQVLVTGYGTQPGAGWTKPLPDTASVSTASYGMFQQPTGSGLCLFVNDTGPGAGGGKEARLTGWDTITSIQSGIVTGSNQFPTAAQLAIGVGAVVARKSVTADGTARSWIIFADSRSFYAFVATGDVAGNYYAFSFGDFYSLKTTPDSFACQIIGRSTENNGTAAVEKLDALSALNTATAGSFIAHTFGGGGGSITAGKHGDATKGSAAALLGTLTYPNSVDNALYLSPVWVCEPTTVLVRGRMRGFYQICHPIASFADGQTFSGSVGTEYDGKIFQILKQGGNASVYCIEISNTLETN